MALITALLLLGVVIKRSGVYYGNILLIKILVDVYIMVRTVWVLLRRDGAN